jgi:hypothetical protein
MSETMRRKTYEELKSLSYLDLKKYQSELEDNGDEYDEADIDMIGDMVESQKYALEA